MRTRSKSKLNGFGGVLCGLLLASMAQTGLALPAAPDCAQRAGNASATNACNEWKQSVEAVQRWAESNTTGSNPVRPYKKAKVLENCIKYQRGQGLTPAKAKALCNEVLADI